MATAENSLIQRLPRQDRLHVMAACEPVELELGRVLCEPQQRTRHVYFPVESFISQMVRIEGSSGLCVGMAGREGTLGVQLALGVPVSPLHALVQGPGRAWRIGVAPFRAELARSQALQRTLDRYLYVLMAQQGASAACLRFHAIAPRLARWLLMSQDRAHCDHFHATHELLSFMLGVRRVGITAAAGELARAGLIEYHRGRLVVRDRAGLEMAACGCYRADLKVYADIMG